MILQLKVKENDLKNEDFWWSFTERFRGSRVEIKKRLNVYVFALNEIFPRDYQIKGLDLGCGRGEWLEIARENNYSIEGLDSDSSMVNYCQNLGLNAKNEDVVKFVKKMNDDQFDLITAFHLVEHLSLEDLKTLFENSYRILKDNGVFIVEFPNISNIFVGSNSFWIDPTHLRPLNSEIVEFVAQFYGFENVEVVKMHSIIPGKKKHKLWRGLNLDLNQDVSVISLKKDASNKIQDFKSALLN